MMYLGNKLILFILVLFIGCDRGIKFDPDWYVGDYLNGIIVPENGEAISCFQPEFDRFACMSEDKQKELAELLLKAELPEELERELLSKIYPSYLR